MFLVTLLFVGLQQDRNWAIFQQHPWFYFFILFLNAANWMILMKYDPAVTPNKILSYGPFCVKIKSKKYKNRYNDFNFRVNRIDFSPKSFTH